MSMMNLDLARMLTEERIEDAARRSRRAQALRTAPEPIRVPRQRRAASMLSRLIPHGGVRISTP